MTKPQDFDPETTIEDDARVPFLKDLGAGNFQDSYILGSSMKAAFANPTTLTLPIQTDGKLVDSFITYNPSTEEYTSTKDWIFPAASISVGPDVKLTNQAGFLSRIDRTIFPNTKNILVDRFYDDDGTDTNITAVKLDPFEWGTFQPFFNVNETITNGNEIVFAFQQLEDAYNSGHIWRGVSGVMRFDVFIDPAQPSGQTEAQAVTSYNSNPEIFVQIVVGAVDMADIDFDNDAPDAWATTTDYQPLDTVTESGTKYTCLEAHTSGTFATDLAANKWRSYDGVQQLYGSDKNFVKGQNLIGVFFPVGGGSVVVKGGDFSGTFKPYFETYFASRFAQNLALQPKIVTVTTTPYTVTDEDILLVDPSAADIVINFPPSADRHDSVTDQARPIMVKNIHDANDFTVSINPDSSEEIDEETIIYLCAKESLEAAPDGSNWWLTSDDQKAAYGFMYLAGNSTATSGSGVNIIAGTYAAPSFLNKFTHSAGRLTYTGKRKLRCVIDVDVGCVEGTEENEYEFTVKLNGTTFKTQKGCSSLGEDQDLMAAPFQIPIELNEDDYIEVFGENVGGSTSYTVRELQVSIQLA